MPIRIKALISAMIGWYAPDFHEMSTKRKGYWFRCDSHRPFYQFIVIGSSQKERILDCDVAWGFFATWDGAYGTHQMAASTSLPCLRLGSKAIPIESCCYRHDGTQTGIRSTLDRIGSELTAYALPWFRRCGEDASRDQLLQHGLDWIQLHDHAIPATIREDLRQALVHAAHMRSRVELPVLDALKRELRDFAAKVGASPLMRKETAILAEHLLLYAGDKRNVG